MATSKFNLKSFLTENREIVLNSFEELKKEQFYNNVPLKTFMIEVANMMVTNNPKSDKVAIKKLADCLSYVYLNNSNIEARDYKTESLTAKYKGTGYMAMV